MMTVAKEERRAACSRCGSFLRMSMGSPLNGSGGHEQGAEEGRRREEVAQACRQNVGTKLLHRQQSRL
eukprot:1353359-Prorocentrum_lima.AAC.1